MTHTRRLAVFFALLVISSPAAAQCDYRSIYSGAYRLTALDLALDGGDLWLATSYGVTLYDRRSDPPVPIASLAIPGPTSEVEVAGQLVYAASGSTLHTLRRAGSEITIIHSLALGATVNDMVAVGQQLYLAASSGIIQVDLLLPDRPAISNRLSTTTGSALSLAAQNGVLYAADGDASIDIYTIQLAALPQKLGVLTTPRSQSTVRVSAGQLYASDGTRTEIFSAAGLDSVRLGTGSFGASALAPHSQSVVYATGTDRRVRAIDVSSPAAPLVLFEQDLAASEGSVNRVSDMISAEGRLYVAAGDLGLVTFDARTFEPPFPLRAHSFGAITSVFAAGTRVFASPGSGGLREYLRSDSGTLTLLRQWDDARTSILHDGSSSRLLTASGNVLVIWDTSVAPPSVVGSATLRAAVRSAVLSGSTAYAVLSDASVWKFDGAAAASQVAVGAARPSFIARGGTALALADLNEEGTTTIRWFANGDPSTTPVTGSVEGAATSGIAASARGVVAAVTFRGLVAIDFSSGAAVPVTFVRPNGSPARDLFAEGDDLFVLTSNALEVWDIPTRQLRKTLALPSAGVAVHASDFAYVATGDGIIVVNHRSTASQPALLPYSRENVYYTAQKVSEAGVHLLRDGAVKSYRVSAAGRPLGELTREVPRGVRDFAAIGSALYTVSESGRVLGPGVEFQMNEGADATALTLHAVRDALYLGLSRGCLSGGCEKKTLIISTSGGGLAQAGSLAGALLDVDVRGDRAFALFDDPDEVRILNVANAAQPLMVSSRAAEGNPVSVAHSSAVATVYTIGQKVYAYSDPSLTKLGELFEPYVADPAGRLSYLDQTIAIDGPCAVLGGRDFSPQVFRIAAPLQWQSVPAPATAGAVRSIATINGSHYLLSDHSLEIWSAAPPPKRRRPAE